MEFDFEYLANNYKIIMQIKDYILTTDNIVLKKKDNGNYIEADVNDEFAHKLLKLTNNTGNYINRYN